MRLINADELMDILIINRYYPFWVSIDEVPTIDAVPVIRCGECLKKRICLLYQDAHDENGFCAWAGRKDTDDK